MSSYEGIKLSLPVRRQVDTFGQLLAVSAGPPSECIPTIVVNSVFLGLAWICVALRLWTRTTVRKSLGWDDFSMLIAAAFLTVYCVSVIDISTRVTISGGFQKMTWDNWLVAVTLLNISEEFYVLSVMALKVSLGIFFHRLTSKPWHRYVIYVDVGITCLFGVALFFFAVFQCGVYPNAATFILRRLGNQCVSNASVLGMVYTHGALSAVTDWTFVLLPIAILKDSLMNRREKYTICAILMFASFSAIAAIIRFKFILGLAVPTIQFFGNSRNLAIWSCIEPAVGIIAGSLVTLRPFFRFFLDRNRVSVSVQPRKRSTQWRLNPRSKPLSLGFRAWGFNQRDMDALDIETSEASANQSSKLFSSSSTSSKAVKFTPSSDQVISSTVDSQQSEKQGQPPPLPPPKDAKYLSQPKRASLEPKTGSRVLRATPESRPAGLPLRLFSSTVDSFDSIGSL